MSLSRKDLVNSPFKKIVNDIDFVENNQNEFKDLSHENFYTAKENTEELGSHSHVSGSIVESTPTESETETNQ
jgi:hypothetical protein